MGIRTTFSPMGGIQNIKFETIQHSGDNGALTYEDTLPKGTFDLILCSSSGSGATAFNSIWYFGSGGSGAVWEGKFKNPKKQQIKIYIGKGAGQEAYMELGGVRMITLTGGSNGSVFNSVSGGAVTINPELNIAETRISGSSKGKTANGYGGNCTTISPCTIRPWGDCTASGTGHTQHNGGFKLSYAG